MASLANLNLPNNIVYDERTKRYHDMFQNYRMVGASRVAAMGTPQRADRSDQYVTRQEFLNMRADLFRFVSHTTELTREALQALFEMQRAQLRDTERLRDYELDDAENRAEGRDSLLKRLASGAMQRAGNVVRRRPGISLAAILGGSILGFAAIPNESVQRFGETVDEAVNMISQLTDILGQIGAAAGILGAAELARRMLQRGQQQRPQPRPSTSPSGAPGSTSSRPAQSTTRPSTPSTPSRTPTSSGSLPMSGAVSRIPPRMGQLQAIMAGAQIAQANQELARGNITREQYREQVSRATGGLMGSVLGGALGGAILGPAGAFVGGLAGLFGGTNIGGRIANTLNAPPTTPEQRNQQAATEEQQLRERAANTPPGSLERRSLARVEAQNMIRTAQQENRLTPQQAQAISIEMGRGGRYQNRHEEVTRTLRQGGNLEISPDVARRLNLPQQVVNGPSGQTQLPPGSIQVLPPISLPNRNQPAAQPRQQAQTPVIGLQIRNPEDAIRDALMQQIIPS